MKKYLLLFPFLGISSLFFGQISNADFETWENVATGQEPNNWNSFLSAGGSLANFAGNQLSLSTDVRPGSSGTKSALLFSNSTLGIIANGNLTLGKINMGNAVPSSTNNYNSSIITDINFSEAFSSTPDSIVFWAKFIPASGNTTDSARVSALLHDNFAVKDPVDATSQTHILGTAIYNFAKTNGSWMRIAVPFSYISANNPSYLLLTFTTNKTPGGGSDNDQLWIDDLLFTNANTIEIKEISYSKITCLINEGNLSFANPSNEEGTAEVYDLKGNLIKKMLLSETFSIKDAGMYCVKITSNLGQFTKTFVRW